MTEYLSVAECLRQNGYRHYCNGMKYLRQGLTQHARGSFVKAQRNYDRAKLMEPVAPKWFLNALARNVADTIMSQNVVATYSYMENGCLIVKTVTDEEMYK